MFLNAMLQPSGLEPQRFYEVGLAPTMYIYLLLRMDVAAYDEYEAAVVVAESPALAKGTHPSGGEWEESNWAELENIHVRELGTAHATQPGVVIARHNTTQKN